MKKLLKLLALLAALAMIAAACASDDGDTDASLTDPDPEEAEADEGDGEEEEAMEDEEVAVGDGVTISYWLWDDNQQPFYEECAANFTADTGINVDVTQFGWGDYWDGLTAGFATGDVPDVFTDHLARYPDFVFADVLVPLNEFVEADGTPTDIYWEGLADLWVAPSGDRFGLPKDFDTIALVVNQDLLDGSGLTVDDLQNLEWNPTDGGTFEEAIAALTVDANGVRGNEDGFDPENVDVYGYISNTVYSDAYGQTGFSTFTGGAGFEFLDANPWGSEYNYDDPAFTDTILWWRSLVEKGYMPPSDILSGSSADTLFAGGQGATMTDGSWKIGTWTAGDVNGAFVPTPIGPSGERSSMYNGLADSITQASEHPEESWQWVQYMASSACQDIIGGGAVVFPAIPSATAIAQEAHAANGIDVSAFTVHVDEGTTFLFPITREAGEIQRIMGNAIDAVMRGEGDAQTIIDANDEINSLQLEG